MKPVIVSGLQPTGNLHLGNYLGAVKNIVDLQNSDKYEMYIFIADQHSLTGDMSAEERREKVVNIAAELFALGIDPDKSTLFIQSSVKGHSDLAWIFNTITPVAELERMTQYKDKSARQTKNINAGLLTYPALMAADILLYHANFVSVGEDQLQHIELTRDIGRFFNNRYGEYFAEPKALLQNVPRVKSLLEPTKKMSKSLGGNHVIELADEPEVIMKKIKKAVTATEGGDEAVGVENLLMLYKIFGDQHRYDQFVSDEKEGTIRYGDLKAELAEAIAAHFEEFRVKRAELLDHKEKLADLLDNGARKAQKKADETMEKVNEMVGLA